MPLKNHNENLFGSWSKMPPNSYNMPQQTDCQRVVWLIQSPTTYPKRVRHRGGTASPLHVPYYVNLLIFKLLNYV